MYIPLGEAECFEYIVLVMKDISLGRDFSPSVNVGSSSVHGQGIIATHAISKDQRVFVFHGLRIHSPYVPEAGLFSSLFPNALGMNDDVWVCPESKENLGTFLNHSCDPSGYVGHGMIIRALRPIKRGEEVTIDYSTTEGDQYWSMTCHCASPKCRGTLYASNTPYWKRASQEQTV